MRFGRRPCSARRTRARRRSILSGATGTAKTCASAPVASASRRKTTSSGPCAISWVPTPFTTSRQVDPMPSAYTLEFEKPLLELERQIEDLKRIGTERQIDIDG